MSPEGLREHAGRKPRLGRSERAWADDPARQAASERARRDHFVRARLEAARMFRAQNRLEPAERAEYLGELGLEQPGVSWPVQQVDSQRPSQSSCATPAHWLSQMRSQQ